MGLLKDVPINKVKIFENEFLEFLELKHRDILDNLSDGILNNDITKVLEKVASELAMKYRLQ
jgi:F-type H+-transporting ATPase subunit alpha